jgi:asparagine synthase (glutamine-hydrolysing)
MCGLIGVVAARGEGLAFTREHLEHARDRMAFRGPDGAGLWEGDGAMLAHRRLAVVDLSPGAAQPMTDGRFVLVYNGELYNDAELRRELARDGTAFATRSDTETILRALALWGPAGLSRLRGMYALALWDTRERTLLLARDPLGIKPLYYRVIDGHVAFGSQAAVLAGIADAPARPDMGVVSSYLTTIRTTLGDRTLFEGVRTLRAGQCLCFDLSRGRPVSLRVSTSTLSPRWSVPGPASAVRDVVIESVRRHLRSDVPLCCLLSGGLDSAIVASIARREAGALHTYCAGAPDAPAEFGGSEDFRYARLVADRIGSQHTDEFVTRELFQARWPEMVASLGQPLSTPNEVAINEVSRRLRADGHKVALSGEGADELFGGYEAPMRAAMEFEAARSTSDAAAWFSLAGRFQLDSNAWVGVAEKESLFLPGAWAGLERDAALTAFYEAEFAHAADGAGDPPAAHLRFHRRVNLAGLLARLDTATMLGEVEGRTPLADAEVAGLAESLPM